MDLTEFHFHHWWEHEIRQLPSAKNMKYAAAAHDRFCIFEICFSSFPRLCLRRHVQKEMGPDAWYRINTSWYFWIGSQLNECWVYILSLDKCSNLIHALFPVYPVAFKRVITKCLVMAVDFCTWRKWFYTNWYRGGGGDYRRMIIQEVATLAIF